MLHLWFPAQYGSTARVREARHLLPVGEVEEEQQQNSFGWSLLILSLFCRDGGLKRAKVKDTFKEEQQKLYSKMLVGTQEDRSRS